jgi:hypothetical protein
VDDAPRHVDEERPLVVPRGVERQALVGLARLVDGHAPHLRPGHAPEVELEGLVVAGPLGLEGPAGLVGVLEEAARVGGPVERREAAGDEGQEPERDEARGEVDAAAMVSVLAGIVRVRGGRRHDVEVSKPVDRRDHNADTCPPRPHPGASTRIVLPERDMPAFY